MKFKPNFLAKTVVVAGLLITAMSAQAAISCFCGKNLKFTAPNAKTAYSYCAKLTPKNQAVRVHSCGPAQKASFGAGDNDCSPQISCGACRGYPWNSQDCHVVNCDGTIGSFTQNC